MERTRFLLLLVVALGAGACSATALARMQEGQLKQVSVGHTGCPFDEIVIRDDRQTEFGRVWVAECRGRRFLCSRAWAGPDDVHYSCKEELPASPGGAAR